MDKKEKDWVKQLFQFFIQGLLVLAPVAITIYIILWLFFNIDTLLLPVYGLLSSNPNEPFYIPGLGFVIIISFVVLVGYLSSFFVVNRAIEIFDHLLERTPGIKVIYSFVKEFSSAFAGKKRRFKKAAFVSIYQPDVWQICFITNEDVSQFGLQDYITVYIPQTYAVAGGLFFVKSDRVKLITDIPPSDVLKFAISGGVVDIDHEHE